MAVYVLYHRDSDGYFAGWCAWNFHKKSCNNEQELKMFGVQYSEPLPFSLDALTKNDIVYILDFSYKREICEYIKNRVSKLVILDHHKTAEKELKGLSYATFDMTKSGALLAWEYFYPNSEPPRACIYVNDRDLWKFEHGDRTRAFESFLRVNAVKDDWEKWTELVNDELYLSCAIAEGNTYLKYERSVVKSMASNPSCVKFVDVKFKDRVLKCAFYEGMGILHSELAEELYKNYEIDFTMEWRIKGNNLTVFSLRSNKIDVSEIAKAFTSDGGGHKAAAGFSFPVKTGLGIVENFYNASTNGNIVTTIA